MSEKEKGSTKNNIAFARILVLFTLLVGIGIGYFVYNSETNTSSRFPFRLGLDLAGGTHLVYKADTSKILPSDVEESMRALREVIERRVNGRDIAGVAGVLDPTVQVSKTGTFSNTEEWRLIVELPGVTDVEKAKALIGETPLLEFKLVADKYKDSVSGAEKGIPDIPKDGYISTELTGRFLERARLEFGQGGRGSLANEPVVSLQFNKEGADLFAKITGEHVGEVLAIFLDGVPIELPVIREEITGGTAVITGSFTPEEALAVVRNLNLGALPVPIEPLSTQSIGASLGNETLQKGVVAGVYGLILVAFFMILWYRLPGLIAVLSLSFYIVTVLAIFKLIPVTLTAAGIAGFVLSIGMAVDANVLIFERMKEELRSGKATRQAVRDGFARAWLSIRDGNISSLITAVVIFYVGTFLTKGFAVTLSIGILVSLFSAITITRALMIAIGSDTQNKYLKFLYGQGMRF